MCAFIRACLQLSSGYVSLLRAALRTERTLLVHRGSRCPADGLSLPAVLSMVRRTLPGSCHMQGQDCNASQLPAVRLHSFVCLVLGQGAYT